MVECWNSGKLGKKNYYLNFKRLASFLPKSYLLFTPLEIMSRSVSCLPAGRRVATTGISNGVYFIIPSFRLSTSLSPHFPITPSPHHFSPASPSPHLLIFFFAIGVGSLQSDLTHSSLSLPSISCCWEMAKSAYFGSLFR